MSEEIVNAIIAGIGSSENATEQAIEVISNLERAGFPALLIAAAPELLDTLNHAEAVMSIVEPRSEKAQYLHCLNRIRADLAAWSERQPKAVQNAVANLDGWLRLATDGGRTAHLSDWGTVDVLACTARAVETLRRATGRA